MSYWTHVNGEMTLVNIKPKEIRKILGTPYDWCDMYGKDVVQNVLGKLFYKGKTFKVRRNKIFNELVNFEHKIAYKRADKKFFYKDNPIPAGSEGSILYKISKHRKGIYKVTFNGDLRDFWEYKSILKWIDGLSKVEDEWEECICECEVNVYMEGIAPYLFYRNSYETNGNHWDENRIITASDYEKIRR